jgi:hypothetical protein
MEDYVMAGRSIAVTVIFAAISVSGLFAQLPQPQTISFQGFLTDPGGAPITDTLQISVVMYDSTGGGVWSEDHPGVPILEGVFSIRLGSITSFESSNVRWNQYYELGISVGADPEMDPRTPLDSAPFVLSSGCEHYGLSPCGATCKNLSSDVQNCGSCGNACIGHDVCSGGICRCPPDMIQCEPGFCVPLGTFCP